MTTSDTGQIPRVLLDNTIQVDRQKMASRSRHIDELLKSYPWTFATSICLLEFKAVIIQECISIHDRLAHVRRYTHVVDAMTEKNWRQVKLRGHIFRNLINIYAPSSFEVSEEDDRRLADKARMRLEQIIPRLYDWFFASVDVVLRNRINCSRAFDRPKKRRVGFGPNLPECRAENKDCRVEDYIREHARPFVESLRNVIEGMDEGQAEQLRRSCELFESVLNDPKRELGTNDCRRAGDFLIALEALDYATHALSTNARDWQPLCDILGYQFVRVNYPDEDRI